MQIIWKLRCSLSRCPGASHRRVALERRKTSKVQTEVENESGTPVIDLPGTVSPEADCSGAGTVPAERNLTPAPLPAWTEEPGLDNPAFEESAVVDSTCCVPLPFASHLCFQTRHSFLLTIPCYFPNKQFCFFKDTILLRNNSHPPYFTLLSFAFQKQNMHPQRRRSFPASPGVVRGSTRHLHAASCVSVQKLIASPLRNQQHQEKQK